MVTLQKIARMGVQYWLTKNDDSGVGRTPTTDLNPAAGPSVPAEDVPSAPALRPRTPKEIIRDAVAILQEGMEKEKPEGDVQKELTWSLNFLHKAARGEDIPVSVKAIIKDRVGRTLVLRDAYSDYWDLPGGHVQEGEPLEFALRREVKEETGIELGLCWQTDTRLLELGSEVKPVMFYQVEYIGGQPRCSEEHLGYQWASDKELNLLNLGVFKDILIPGPEDRETLEVGYAETYKQSGPMQVPHYTAKEGEGGGISTAGDTMTSEDSHTPAIGPGKRKKIERLVSKTEWDNYLNKVSTGGHLVTGNDAELMPPTPPKWEQRSMKLVKGLSPSQYSKTKMKVLSKAVGAPFVVAGYASPVVVDREGHRISHAALAEDVPRFMAYDGRYANLNVMHTNATVGRLIPEFIGPDGTVYKTGVDDIGFFAVAEVRTDPYAPAICEQVIQDIESGYLKSFSISGNGDNPVFTCDDQQCFYDIGKVNLLELTLCLPPEEEIWTRKGLTPIGQVNVGDEVLTHLNRWQPVEQVMSRQINESILRVTTEDGVVRLTNNHPVRSIRYRGQHEGSHYEWVPAEQLKVGDLVQVHRQTAICAACEGPIFKAKYNKFCSLTCRYAMPNRKGKTLASGDPGAISHSAKVRGITKAERPSLSGGIQTEEGRARWRESTQTASFREKARTRAQAQWADPEYVAKRLAGQKCPNLIEESFAKATGLEYVGDGKLIIDRKRPDFYAGPGKVVELFGDYWHRGETGEERINFFNERGYECLVVWEGDFKKNAGEVVARVQEFANNGLSKVVSIEEIAYQGTVCNLEVAEDHSFTSPALVLHNCEEGVNQDAKFEVVSKAKGFTW